MMQIKINYSRPVLSVRDFQKESGHSLTLIKKALRSEWATDFSYRTSDAPKAKQMIVCEDFDRLLRQGAFR